MEKDLLIAMVQGRTGYTFVNKSLLLQAFTRRSYTEENGGQNNEVLEFIGDKALDFAVVKLLSQKFGNIKMDNPKNRKSINMQEIFEWNNRGSLGEFVCECDEGELTRIKSKMVEKRYLARRIDELGFADGLIMGKGDMMNNVQNEMSVKEDLFEAIIGAVAIDCGWDFDKIQSVVETMLVPEDFFLNDEDDNYVRIIQEWEAEENGVIPYFWFKETTFSSTFYDNFDGISQRFSLIQDTSKIRYICDLKLLDKLPVFRGFGVSKSEARMNVCKLAYEWLVKNGYISEFTMKDELEDEPTKENAINQLEILARRGCFSIPVYDFSQKYDKNGNPIWICSCKINEYDFSECAVSSSKKDAKKTAALAMLERLLNKEDE